MNKLPQTRYIKKEFNPRDKCILIVEDDEGILQVMKEILKGERYHVLIARSAGQAYDLLHTFIPHLFIVDYWLTDGESGAKFIKWLKKQNEYRKLPIIFTTAHLEIPDEIREYSGIEFLIKPFHVIDLISTVRDCLGKGNK